MTHTEESFQEDLNTMTYEEDYATAIAIETEIYESNIYSDEYVDSEICENYGVEEDIEEEMRAFEIKYEAENEALVAAKNIQNDEDISSVSNEITDFSTLSDEELVSKFDREKSHDTFKHNVERGLILLEIKNRNKSDKTFGHFLKKHSLETDLSQKHRNRLMHLAKFFAGKDFEGINITSGYLISSGKYAKIAENVYQTVLGKNYSIEQTKELLEKKLEEHEFVTEKIASEELSIKKEKSILLDVTKKNQGLNLENLSDIELANQYLGIHQQSQLFKGMILLEARTRFPSNNEFHQWVDDHGLSVDSQQQRTDFMNLARFFKDRSMDGIKLTSAYKISSPNNEVIAEEIYNEVYGKSLTVKEVEKLIVEKRKENNLSSEAKVKPLIDKIVFPQEDVRSFIESVTKSYPSKSDAIQLLKNCIRELQKESPAIQEGPQLG